MSVLYITEFAHSGNSNSGAVLQVASMPPLADQQVVFTTSSVQSAAFNDNTRFIRVHTDATCHVAFGDNPTALTSSMRLLEGWTEYFAVKAGQKVAVIGLA